MNCQWSPPYTTSPEDAEFFDPWPEGWGHAPEPIDHQMSSRTSIWWWFVDFFNVSFRVSENPYQCLLILSSCYRVQHFISLNSWTILPPFTLPNHSSAKTTFNLRTKPCINDCMDVFYLLLEIRNMWFSWAHLVRRISWIRWSSILVGMRILTKAL